MQPPARSPPRTAYGPLSTLFRSANDPSVTADEVGWYASRLPRGAGSILQGMVGSGSLTLALLETGFNVHGIDASETMLAACRARIAAAGRDAYVFRQNLSTLNLPFRYGAAFVAAGAFQAIVDRAMAIAALSRVRAHFVDPGVLVLDLFVPEAADHPPGAPLIEVRHVTLEDGSQIVRRSETRFDVAQQRMDIASRYEQRRTTRVVAREIEALAKTWYSEAQVITLLEEAGYGAIHVEASARRHVNARTFAISARA
jgi:Methyltransferase domain